MAEIQFPGQKYGLGTSFDERKSLEERSSSSKLLNSVAREAGCLEKGRAIEVHGEDKTYREVKHEQEGHLYELENANADQALTLAEGSHALIEVVGLFAKNAITASPFFAPTGIALTGASLVYHQVEAWQHGDDRNAALRSDAMHCALLGGLSGLPSEYKSAELEKRSEARGGGNGSPAAKILEKLNQHPEMKVLLQLRCDEGMHVARQFIDGNFGSKDAFLKANTGFEGRYLQDPAFRVGFDAMTWAHDKGGASEVPLMQSLHGRDARFDATSNSVWPG